jgi:hypothetical protein
MKTKKLMPFCVFGLVLLLLPRVGLCQAIPGTDNTTLVVFARHTFRGISKKIGPQKISLPQYGIDIAIPLLSYGEEATPEGLSIAEHFAAPGLQEAAALAVAAIRENQVFDGQWDEIRAELAVERTFWTGLYLKKGLEENGPQHNRPIKFTGCPIDPAKDKDAIDAVSSDHPVRKCVPPDVYSALIRASPDLPKLKNNFQNFLNTVRAAIGLPQPVEIPDPVYTDKNMLPPEYDQIAALASIIEMIADLGPPLPQIFRSGDRAHLMRSGKLAVQRGVNGLGIRFFTSEPSPLSDAVSVIPVNYMMSRPRGSHTIVVTHDNFMSALMSSLGIISSSSAPDDWAIFPIESYVFAFGNSNVSVVRMRIDISDRDGAMPGNYASQIVWRGGLSQWNQKVRALNQRASTMDLSACDQPVTECEARRLRVVFHTPEEESD